MRRSLVSDQESKIYDTSSFHAVLRRNKLAYINFASFRENGAEVTIRVRREDGEHDLIGVIVRHVVLDTKKRKGELAIIKPKSGSYLDHWDEVPIWRCLPGGPVGILKKRGVLKSAA